MRHRRFDEDVKLRPDEEGRFAGSFPITTARFERDDAGEVTALLDRERAGAGRSVRTGPIAVGPAGDPRFARRPGAGRPERSRSRSSPRNFKSAPKKDGGGPPEAPHY